MTRIKKFVEFLRFSLRPAKKLFWLYKLVLLIFDKLPFYFYEQSKYQNRPIYSIRSLALSLGMDEQLLINTAANSDDYFQLNQQTKKDGSLRDCYNLKKPLKVIHKQLRKKLISKVEYPWHTQGSIKGCSNITNAKLHEKSKTLFN